MEILDEIPDLGTILSHNLKPAIKHTLLKIHLVEFKMPMQRNRNLNNSCFMKNGFIGKITNIMVIRCHDSDIIRCYEYQDVMTIRNNITKILH